MRSLLALSFGLFLLDALPVVLLVTLVARLAAAAPLDAGRTQELVLLGYPLLYLLLALVGLQTLALERDRLRSPNLWGFGVCQPLLALAEDLELVVISAPKEDDAHAGRRGAVLDVEDVGRDRRALGGHGSSSSPVPASPRGYPCPQPNARTQEHAT